MSDKQVSIGREVRGDSRQGPAHPVGHRGRQRDGEDHPHRGPGRGARRRPDHLHRGRRLPPLRPGGAQVAPVHPAPPPVQLHRHHGAAPPAPRPGPAHPEADLQPRHRQARPARVRRAHGLRDRRGPPPPPHPPGAGVLRHHRLPRPAGGHPHRLEAGSRHQEAGLHRGAGAGRAPEAGAGVGRVHPPAAGARRHRGAVLARSRSGARRPTTPSAPTSCCGRRSATPT